MITIENTNITGWEAAIRGMRNPKNSWAKSDTTYMDNHSTPKLGENDLKLMSTLANARDDHGKCIRYIMVSMDVTAPLYWWKEFDTYKVGTVANSCSTMHKIADNIFTVKDFSFDELYAKDIYTEDFLKKYDELHKYIQETLEILNKARENYISEKNDVLKKFYWRTMIKLLPESFNQKRTILLNYQVLKRIYFARKDHKLTEWRNFCKWIESLPYANDLICHEYCMPKESNGLKLYFVVLEDAQSTIDYLKLGEHSDLSKCDIYGIYKSEELAREGIEEYHRHSKEEDAPYRSCFIVEKDI